MISSGLDRSRLQAAVISSGTLLALLAAQGLGAAGENGSVRRPNVILFITDDQGALDAGCYGSSDLSTPHIDRLARDGVRFTQAYAHTVCCPARAALMTGRHPQRSNVNSWVQSRMQAERGRNLALEEVTLAEAFQRAGYRTALFGKWHLGADADSAPLRQGFDDFFGILGGFVDNFNHYCLHDRGFHDLYENTSEVYRPGEYLPELVCRRAEAFVGQHSDRPFCLCFSINLPHYPEQACETYRDAYGALPEPRRSYAQVVSTCDYYLGRLLARLDELGLTRDTIILFTSDNGPSEEQHTISVSDHASGLPNGHDYGANGGGGNTGPWLGAKGSFLEGGLRVPAIVSYPAQLPQGEVRRQAVTIMDWFPTLLELSGVELAEAVQLDGRSLKQVIEDPDAAGPHQRLHWQWQDSWAVREGDWKLIHNGRVGLRQRELDPVTLVNLADDSPEAKNYAEARPELVRRLQAAHDDWAQDVFTIYKP